MFFFLIHSVALLNRVLVYVVNISTDCIGFLS